MVENSEWPARKNLVGKEKHHRASRITSALHVIFLKIHHEVMTLIKQCGPEKGFFSIHFLSSLAY